MVSRRDPRQARFLTRASLRWIVRNRAWTPFYLVRYLRFLRLRLRHPHVVTEGFVFLGRRTEVYARKGYGRLVLGRWTHFGDRTAVRCHEGNLRVGEKAVFGQDISLNCYLDVEVGAATLVADDVYVADFDHRTDDLTVPIKDQGIVKRPVRIGPDVWIGTKATVLRGTEIGRGAVVGANSVVTRDVPDYAIACGVPARVVRSRLTADEPRRPSLPAADPAPPPARAPQPAPPRAPQPAQPAPPQMITFRR